MRTSQFLCIISLLLTFASAKGQSPASNQLNSKPQNGKVGISFDDELITGKTDLPAAEFIQNRLNNRYKRMIKIRKDFIQDVENSKDDFRAH